MRKVSDFPGSELRDAIFPCLTRRLSLLKEAAAPLGTKEKTGAAIRLLM
jgi:hypothetical protein